MLGIELEYLKQVVSHYWCSSWWCRVNCQAITRNREALCVVMPDNVVEPPSGLHFHFA